VAREVEPSRRTCQSCPVCFGSGQITGPKSITYRREPNDPFNAEIRLCDECEGTGVVTLLTAAAIEAAVMQRVIPIVEKIMGDWRYEMDAIAQWEAEGGALHAG
jgi:RecJ-like exonuclease